MQSSKPKDSDGQIEPLPVRQLGEVSAQQEENKWLIEELWLQSGVGILGGLSKLGKTFLAAELSVAVASCTNALGRFATKMSGPVLFFGAEDSLPNLRTRFDGLLALRRLQAKDMPIYLIDVAVLRLDQGHDLSRLRAAIKCYCPKLLVLDPFVRIAAIDENSAAEVSALLGSLRQLQRDYDLAVLLVHHARKSPAAHPTQALRGSGDFAAWSDTNLCLFRQGKDIGLFIEHRNARAPQPLRLRLATDPAPHLLLVDNTATAPSQQPDALQSQLLNHLGNAPQPMPTVQLRDLLGRRKADVVHALEQLTALGRVRRTAQGWTLAETA